MAQEQRRVQALGVHAGHGQHVAKSFGRRVREADRWSERQRHADVVHRPEAAFSLESMRFRDQGSRADQCGLAIVVGEIEIGIERERMRDHHVVGLVAGSGERAVRDEPPDNGEHDADEKSTASPLSGMLDARHAATG